MLRCPSNDCRARVKFTVNANKWRQSFTATIDGDKTIITFKDGTTLDEKDFTKFFSQNGKYKMTCTTCGHKESTNMFRHAFKNPMSCFDTDNLCDCGGEIWNDIELLQQKTEITGDAEWEDGDSQRKVIMGVKNTRKCERCNKVYGRPEIDRGI